MTSAKETEAAKPRVKFCWHCGRRLWGQTFVEREIEGHPRVLHKTCAEDPENVVRDDEEIEAAVQEGRR